MSRGFTRTALGAALALALTLVVAGCSPAAPTSESANQGSESSDRKADTLQSRVRVEYHNKTADRLSFKFDDYTVDDDLNWLEPVSGTLYPNESTVGTSYNNPFSAYSVDLEFGALPYKTSVSNEGLSNHFLFRVWMYTISQSDTTEVPAGETRTLTHGDYRFEIKAGKRTEVFGKSAAYPIDVYIYDAK